ncbi:MAG: hypothetical protein NVV59_07675 [Chitinophagaceae bacterium]|nr:hypothetical protein [Chitinophagaceae bacterium]
MKQELNRDEWMDRVLNSLDGVERAQAQPWFYTRLMARLKKEETTTWERISGLISRPSVAITSLCLVLLMNVFFLLQSDSDNSINSVAQTDQVVESESLIASSSSFDYENITP